MGIVSTPDIAEAVAEAAVRAILSAPDIAEAIRSRFEGRVTAIVEHDPQESFHNLPPRHHHQSDLVSKCHKVRDGAHDGARRIDRL
jgi:hypothetical protein